jgi:hypothetical protein
VQCDFRCDFTCVRTDCCVFARNSWPKHAKKTKDKQGAKRGREVDVPRTESAEKRSKHEIVESAITVGPDEGGRERKERSGDSDDDASAEGDSGAEGAEHSGADDDAVAAGDDDDGYMKF